MQPIHGEVRVKFHYAVHFTTDLFSPENSLLRDVVAGPGAPSARGPSRVLFVVDQDVETHRPVVAAIHGYFQQHRDALALAGVPVLLPGASG